MAVIKWTQRNWYNQMIRWACVEHILGISLTTGDRWQVTGDRWQATDKRWWRTDDREKVTGVWCLVSSGMFHTICHVSPLTCHFSPVILTCQVSAVICHLSPAIGYISPVTLNVALVICHLSPVFWYAQDMLKNIVSLQIFSLAIFNPLKSLN